MRVKIALCIISSLLALLTFWRTSSAPSADAQPQNPPQQNQPQYLGPTKLAATKDGKTLYVLCEDSKQVAVVDPGAGKPTAFWSLPGQPTGLCLSPDQNRLYVTCAKPQGAVCVLELPGGKLVQEIPVGYWACGPSVSPDGAKLYVCNRFQNSISVVDLAAGKEVARIPAVREPIASAITPDGKTLFVANHLPNDRADSYDVAAVVTVVDTASNQASPIRLLNGSTGLRSIYVSPDGRYVYIPHLLARYQMPTTQLERGWMNTNALTILDAAQKKRINTVLLDDIDLGAAIPWDVACTPDGRWICVSHYGTHELTVIDGPAMLEKLAKLPDQLPTGPNAPYVDRSVGPASLVKDDVPNDLSFLVGLKRRIRLGGAPPYQDTPESAKIKGPRGVVVVGNKAYVAVYFSDLLCVVDLAETDAQKAQRSIVRLPLGPEPVWTLVRKGHINFIDAALCFQQWQSCESCHPEGRVDGLNWDLLNDGLGTPKNNKSMLFAHKTPPSMWTGVRPTAEDAVRSGIRHIQFAVRPEEDAVAIDEYLKTLQPVPSPYLVNGRLSEAAERGKKIFFDPEIGCATCHPEPLYTDMKMHNVNSRGPLDRRDEFDTPSLIECWRTAPYMHDGRYVTMKEVFTEGKHGATVGKLEKLTPQQIDDLVEFILSL
jgi:YVTN family beta-propeller protein